MTRYYYSNDLPAADAAESGDVVEVDTRFREVGDFPNERLQMIHVGETVLQQNDCAALAKSGATFFSNSGKNPLKARLGKEGQ